MKEEDKIEIVPSKKSKNKVRKRLKRLTKKNTALSWSEVVKRIQRYIRGWISYFRKGEVERYLGRLN